MPHTSREHTNYPLSIVVLKRKVKPMISTKLLFYSNDWTLGRNPDWRVVIANYVRMIERPWYDALNTVSFECPVFLITSID